MSTVLVSVQRNGVIEVQRRMSTTVEPGWTNHIDLSGEEWGRLIHDCHPGDRIVLTVEVLADGLQPAVLEAHSAEGLDAVSGASRPADA